MNNLWADTAVEALATNRLEADIATDVLVIGAGYAGLSTALHLAQAGVDAIVVDAHESGWGASGRNGGQVIPGVKYGPEVLIKRFGDDLGGRLARFAAGSAEFLFALIAENGMRVPVSRAGWIQGAHSIAAAQRSEKHAKQLAKRGEPVQFLDRREMARFLGSSEYSGGLLDPRGGSIHPLSLARELARTAVEKGARLFSETRIRQLRHKADGWNAVAESGPQISAKKIVVCTNAYSDELIPGLSKSVIAASSLQVATEPLGDRGEAILPKGHVLSDTRKVIRYFRKDDQGRFIMGGRGPFRDRWVIEDWRHLETVARRLFPALRDVRFTHRWGGRVAIHPDFLPHVHEPETGLLVNIGCQGRGVAWQTTMGSVLARYTISGNPQDLPLPLSAIRPMPLAPLRRHYASALVQLYRVFDL